MFRIYCVILIASYIIWSSALLGNVEMSLDGISPKWEILDTQDNKKL